MLYEDGLLYGLVLHSPMAILDCLQSGEAAPGKYQVDNINITLAP